LTLSAPKANWPISATRPWAPAAAAVGEVATGRCREEAEELGLALLQAVKDARWTEPPPDKEAPGVEPGFPRAPDVKPDFDN
jgi:hypothetical protein